MSDLSVSSAVSSTQQNQRAERKGLFDQLGQALKSGDLAGAKKAFAALQASAPQGAPPQGRSTQDPFAALATALQNNDLSGAQQAFAQIQQTRGHHHHRQATSTASSTTPATASAAMDRDGDHDGSRGGKVNLTA